MRETHQAGSSDTESQNPSSVGWSQDRPPMREVAGKVAFVTGGDSGIGLGIVRVLVNAGMKVIITYRSKEHLDQAMDVLAEARDCVYAIYLDVTDRLAMANAASEATQVFGKVHLLVNNAGISHQIPVRSATFDDWDWCMNVNLNGVFNGIRAFLPHISSHGEGGHIVATSSLLGMISLPFCGVYSTSKFAVVGMMEALRSELAFTNIGVSVFCPAGVRTNLGQSGRNRPHSLSEAGTLDSETLQWIRRVEGAIGSREHAMDETAIMDPLEAGERVLRGIRRNDLYIFSHSEYEQVLRDRAEALINSIPKNEREISKERIAIARTFRNPMYLHELWKKGPG